MHSVIIYYFLASSAVLFYGIGINKSISHSEDFSATMLTCIKSLFAAGSATAVTFLFSRWLLIPVHLTEIILSSRP